MTAVLVCGNDKKERDLLEPVFTTLNTPSGRIFFRHTSLNFLAIHKVCLRKFASSGGKISRPSSIFGCEYRFLSWDCRKQVARESDQELRVENVSNNMEMLNAAEEEQLLHMNYLPWTGVMP